MKTIMRNFLIVPVLLLLLAACQNTTQKQENEQETTEEKVSQVPEKENEQITRGNAAVKAVFASLSSELKAALQREGVPGAVQYCNTRALPITDSVSQALGVSVQRVTNQPRNAQNKLTEADEAAWAHFAATKPAVKPAGILDDSNVFYKPIFVQPLCLNCHGTPGKDLMEENYAAIKELYPEDKAINYSMGDLRGLWKVSFVAQ
jgi:hypothetical protein